MNLVYISVYACKESFETEDETHTDNSCRWRTAIRPDFQSL